LVQGPVMPGDEVTVEVEFTAPILPGKYCSFFRFVHGNNQRFGQKVWCDVMVDPSLIQEKPKGSSLLMESVFEPAHEPIIEPVIEPLQEPANLV